MRNKIRLLQVWFDWVDQENVNPLQRLKKNS